MPKTILVVEGCADTRGLMIYMIRIMGFQVLEACDGFEAVAMAKQFLPSLILMDLSMPRLDGCEATELIRGCAELKKLPIIAVTAHDRDEWEKAIAAGCDDILQKPVDLESLRSVVQSLVGFEGH